jgi:hypothetical protein
MDLNNLSTASKDAVFVSSFLNIEVYLVDGYKNLESNTPLKINSITEDFSKIVLESRKGSCPLYLFELYSLVTDDQLKVLKFFKDKCVPDVYSTKKLKLVAEDWL